MQQQQQEQDRCSLQEYNNVNAVDCRDVKSVLSKSQNLSL